MPSRYLKTQKGQTKPSARAGEAQRPGGKKAGTWAEVAGVVKAGRIRSSRGPPQDKGDMW